LSSLSYLCDDCHKQAVLISESRGDSNRCTPCRGKHDQHATLSTLDSRMVPDHTSPVVRVANLSLAPTRMKHAPTPERNLGDRRQTGPVIVLGHLIPPPSRQPWSRGERLRPSGDATTSAYWAHNTSIQSVCSILAHGGQPIGP
jgi:DNA-directed RNA polymerase subunit RPC12/RpoP